MALSNPTKLTIVIEDPEGKISTSYRDLIIENIRFAWNRWDAFIDANSNASIDLVVRPLNNTDNTLASAGSIGSVWLYGNVLRGTVGYELIYGIDNNGKDFDGVINISTYHLNQNKLDFSLGGVTPNNRISFNDIVTHEIGHILGLNGWFNNSIYQSPFELLVDQEKGVFVGKNAVAVNGGPVKLEASSAPTHTNEQTFGKAIMSPILENGNNEDLSLVELAILADIGLPINIDFISSNISFNKTTEEATNFTESDREANIIVTRSNNSLDETVTVDYTTVGGNATSGKDFTPVSGTLIFSSGVTTQIITVPIIDDVFREGREDFSVVLSNPVNAEIDKNNDSLVINIDDESDSESEDQILVSMTDSIQIIGDGNTKALSIELKNNQGELVQALSDITLQLDSMRTRDGESLDVSFISDNGQVIIPGGSSRVELVIDTTHNASSEGIGVIDIKIDAILSGVGFERLTIDKKHDAARLIIVNTLSSEAVNEPDNEFFIPHFDVLVDGGVGIDTMIFDDIRSQFDIALKDKSHTIISTTEITQETVSIERLQFQDISLAIDIDGNAGKVAKILGSVFGVDALSNKEYVGIGLNLLDEGMSYADLSALALKAAGASTFEEIIIKLYTNVVGVAPTVDEKFPFVALLENGATIGELGMIAGDSDLNISNIDLIGLSQTGIEFI